ncbi:MAG TPA: glycoside hydrolase family 44 protein [Terracidiphilus sp.]|nr:glycoside hydrolase family 44 protein [Terracidiphilus sp.]
MNDSRRPLVPALGFLLCALMSGCGGKTVLKAPISLTVNSTSPTSGVPIKVAPADVNGAGDGTTSFIRNYAVGTTVTLTAPATEPGGNGFSFWSGCTTTNGATCTVAMTTGIVVSANYIAPAVTPTVTVTPNLSTITTSQQLIVTITVAGNSGAAPATGSVTLTSGSYSSGAIPVTQGSSIISIAAGQLAVGSDTLTAAYTPDAASTGIYNAASGTGTVTVTSQGSTGTVPAAPTGLAATAGDAQVALAWNSSPGATSYNVKRGTANGGPYTTVGSPAITSYTDTGLTNGTTYYYVVTAVDGAGESSNSNQASATPTGSGSSGTAVTINVLADRHTISPYIYGGSYPQDAAHVTDSGTTLVRWGGNATSTYNWQLQSYNAGNDYYFEDFAAEGFSGGGDGSSTQFITDVQNAGSHPLMTMVMLPWVAQSPETSTTQGGTDNYHWSYSVASFGAQCSTDTYNTDAGDGLKSDCSTPVTTSAVTSAYDPLLDDNTQSCSGSTCVYRNAWAQALATAFGSGTCAVPYFSSTSCHFYDMDNEMEIWGSTHRDVHPNPSGYDELANDFLTEAPKLQTWDPQAVRFGPVTCCWWYYWNGANNNDKAAHGGVDFVPWWLNQVYWQDQISGARSLDVFDLHAYPDADTSSLTQAQLQALAVSIYRDYWDPTFVSPSSSINQQYTTNIQPNKTIPFRIPRMRAIVNMIYPGTPLSFTEWSAAFAGESDFSTALGDADAYGILGRERVSFASRWEAPVPTHPNYQALKLYTNYDGAHDGFGTTSVSDTNDGNPSLFSSYAALDSTGKTLTVIVLNKDPQNAAQAQFTLTGFNPTSYTSYTLSSITPTAITASTSQSWSASQTFAPYTATLLVISGSLANTPASDWDLNPDTIMVPQGGTTTLQPKIISGTSNVTLSSAVFDSYEGTTACGGTLAIGTSTVSTTTPGSIAVNMGTTSPGFCHFTVTGNDGSVTQTEGGWIVVGNPPATLTPGGSGQVGSAGSTLANPLTATLAPGQSGGAAAGASILFTTSAGSLSNGTNTGTKVIAVTNSSGVASVTLTLPGSAGPVQVAAQAPIALGGAVASFSETAQ